MATPGTRPARRTQRPARAPGGAGLRRPVTAAVAVVLLGVLGACSSADAGTPSAASTSSPTPTRSAATPSATPTRAASPTPTPTPTTAPEPAASPAPAAGGDAGAGSGATTGVQLRSGGRVGGLPVEAPEADVVAHLTDVMGTGPTVEDPSSACGYDVGRRLRFGDLVVFVRTVDALGAPADAYMASWAVGEPSSPLATVEGLRVGDPEARIPELYPGATSGQDDHSPGSTWWNAEADGATYTFLAEGGTVTRLASGAVCGE